MFLMVRNDLFHTEQMKGNSENIQEKPKLTYTNMEEMQTKQKGFFGVRKFLIDQTRKELVSNYNCFDENENHKINLMVEKNTEKVKWIPTENRKKLDTSFSSFDNEDHELTNEEELLDYFLEKIM